ncbi:hypothetical protein BH11PSE11_BH11PSE11_25860 [soil metagenome]
MTEQLIEIRLMQQSTQVEMDWVNGETTRVSAAALRRFCRCAECTSAARKNGPSTTDHPDLQISLIAPMGENSLNLQFSDGHTRGIYPFEYLRSLTLDKAA